MKKVGIVAKPDAPSAPEVVRRLVQWLPERGLSALLDKETAGLVPDLPVTQSSRQELPGQVDVIVVLGYLVLYLVHQKSMAIDPSRLGKVNTFFELFTVGFALMSLARPALPMAIPNVVLQSVTAVTSAASGIHYVYRGLLWHQTQSNQGR